MKRHALCAAAMAVVLATNVAQAQGPDNPGRDNAVGGLQRRGEPGGRDAAPRPDHAARPAAARPDGPRGDSRPAPRNQNRRELSRNNGARPDMGSNRGGNDGVGRADYGGQRSGNYYGPGGYGGERGAGPDHGFYRGQRLPPQYRSRQYVVDNWREHRLSPPPRGYQWVQTGADYVLVAIATGLILQLLLDGN